MAKPVKETAAATLPYEIVCWTPASGEAVAAFAGKKGSPLDPAPFRGHREYIADARKACREATTMLGLGARGEVRTLKGSTNDMQHVVYGCRAISGADGSLTIAEEDQS